MKKLEMVMKGAGVSLCVCVECGQEAERCESEAFRCCAARTYRVCVGLFVYGSDSALRQGRDGKQGMSHHTTHDSEQAMASLTTGYCCVTAEALG